MSWWPWPSKRSVQRRFQHLWDHVIEQTEVTTRALLEMREKMATTDELVARFGAATDEIARDLQALRDEVAGGDAAVAAKFEPLVSRLEAMGADPENPVPDPEPEPEPEA